MTLRKARVDGHVNGKTEVTIWGASLTYGQLQDLSADFASEECVEALDMKTSSLLLAESNKSLRTEPIEIVVGALVYCFSRKFRHRCMPLVFVIGGRDQDQPLSDSRPVVIPIESTSTRLEAVMLAKDGMRAELATHGVLRSSKVGEQLGTLTLATKSACGIIVMHVQASFRLGRVFILIQLGRKDEQELRLEDWARVFMDELVTTAEELQRAPPRLTLSDLPLLSLSYHGLDSLLHQQLFGLRVDPGNVKDIFPCSPLQEGVLLSKSSYDISWIWNCVPPHGSDAISPARLQEAWKTAVRRHDMFSTVFSMHPEEDSFIQIVMATPTARILQLHSTASPAGKLAALEKPVFRAEEPKHLLTILSPLSSDDTMEDVPSSIALPAEALAGITGFCRRKKLTRSVFVHIAWALVLSYFTGADDVCFGYMASGRDIPVEGVDRVFGPLANTVISRIDLRTPLEKLMTETAAMLKEHRRHQQTSLAEIQRSLGVSGGRRLFNSLLSLLKATDTESLLFKKHSQFDLVLEGYLEEGSISLCLHYRAKAVRRDVAEEVCVLLMRAIDYVVSTEGTNGVVNGIPDGRVSSRFFKHAVGADKHSTRAYWQCRLGEVENLNLVFLKGPKTPSVRDADETITMRGLGRKHLCTTEMAARAAWSVIVAQASESDTALFGVSVTDGRQRLMGKGASVLPLAVSLDWSASVDSFMESLQKQTEDMARYEGVSLHWLRQIQHQAVDFQSLLVCHGRRDVVDSWNGPFVLELRELDDETACLHISFDSRVVTRRRVVRIGQQFEYLVRELLNGNRGKEMLRNLRIIPPQHLDHVWAWNCTVPEPVESSVQELIRARVLAMPRALAIDAWDGTLTFAQLDERSDALARRLVADGIGPGALVPLCFEKSMWMSVAMLGVIKSGAAAVGLDPKQPEDRLREIIKAVRARLVLASSFKEHLARRVSRCPVLVVDSNLQDGNQPLPAVDPSEIVYAVFTSGSTGKPKGVLVTQRSLSSAAVYQREAFGFGHGPRVLDFSSYCFDAAWFNLVLTLTSGGCLCVPSEKQLEGELEGCFERYDIGLAFLTPSVVRHLDVDALGRLDTLLIGGEIVLPSDVSGLSGYKTQVKIIYGPSECTPMTTRHDLTEDGTISIGRGVGVCTWIVDQDHGQSLVPIGMIGELVLEGPLLGQGYIDEPEKTKASFIQDATWLLQGKGGVEGRHGRIYRTGDLVRYDDDGNIVYVRRKDRQVKIRGQRVELAEVEQHVLELLQTGHTLDTTKAHVIAETMEAENSGSSMLVSFVSIQGETEDGDEDGMKEQHAVLVQSLTRGLSKRLSDRVPAYMVPVAFIPVRIVPKTLTGKTNQARLREIGLAWWKRCRAMMNDDEDEDGEGTRASTNMERMLQEVWMTVLNLPTRQLFSIDKAFTRLGGDSISAMQVVSKCRALKIIVPSVSDVLEASTIRRLAPRCHFQKRPTQQDERGDELERDEAETMAAFSLSPMQQRLMDFFPDGINHFNQSFVLETKRELSVEGIVDALHAVVKRHGMLRARFHKDDKGVWEQSVVGARPDAFAFAYHAASSREEALEIGQQRQEKLDMVNGPVFACDLIDLNDSQIVVLSAHHLVVDLVSWRLIWRDIQEHVQTGCLGGSHTASFRTWCRFQAEAARHLSPEAVLPYPVPAADLSFWGVSPAENTGARCEDLSFALDLRDTELLLGYSNDGLRTEPLDILLGSFAYSFAEVFFERSSSLPAIFVEGHGREQLEADGLDVSETVGWFTTMLPVAIDGKAATTVVEAIRLAKDTRRRVPGKGQPYFASRLYSRSCRSVFRKHHDVELLVNFAGRYQQLESRDGLFRLVDASLRVVSASARRFALIEANMVVQNGRLSVTFTFNKDMKHQSRLRSWFPCFMDTLTGAVRMLEGLSPRLTLSDVGLLSLSYRGLNRLLDEVLPELGLEAADVVDAYPASPMQEGILLSGQTGSCSYATYWIWTCTANGGHEIVSPRRLETAWRGVVSQHAILSTVFAPHPEGSGFVQMVLAKPRIQVSQMSVTTGTAAEALSRLERPEIGPASPLHAFTVCRGGADLVAAEVIRHIRGCSNFDKVSYWAAFLEGVRPCEVAVSFAASDAAGDGFTYIPIPSESVRGVRAFCREMEVSRSAFLQVIWAMVLSQLVGLPEVCFGYLASGRGEAIDGIESIVGPLANMLYSRVDLRDSKAGVFRKTWVDSIEHLKYQHVSLARVQHAMDLSGRRLFNTAMSVREEDCFESDERSISLAYHSHQDPHEYDLLLAGFFRRDGSMNLSIQFREATVSRQLAEEAAATLAKAIDYAMTRQKHEDSTLDVAFFRHVVGSSESETMAFWGDYLSDLDANYFPPLRKPSSKDGRLVLRAGTARFSFNRLDEYTVAEVVAAAWTVMAARKVGSSEALVGVSSRGRELLLRVRLDWTVSGTELLQLVRRQLVQRPGFHVIRRASDEAALACNLQANLVIEERGSTTCMAPDAMETIDYDVVVNCQVQGEEASLTVWFDGNSVSEPVARSAAAQLQHVLDWLSDDKRRESSIVEAIEATVEDLEQIWAWNTPVPVPVERCVHDMIHQTAQMYPQAQAVCGWDGDLTYQQLDSLATALAHRLVAEGATRGCLVPLLFDKSAWMPVAMLAVIKAGSAAVAMDTTQPEGRLRDILSQLDGGQVVVSSVANEHLARRLSRGREPIVVGRDALPRSTAIDKLPTVYPSDTLYAVFTSGSTGSPKAALITHSNMSSAVVYQQEALELTRSSRVFDFASYAFDVAWDNFVHALTCGGCLCIPSEAERLEDVEGAVVALRANYLHITPTLLRCLDWSKLGGVSVVVLSGEPVLAEDLAIVPDCVRMVNAYGPAETNVVTVQKLDTRLPVSIGRGTGSCTWIVDVDRVSSLTPIGTAGELWIEGPLVGDGYLNDCRRTNEVFVDDPDWLLRGTADRPGRSGRLYRTGDLVRYNNDGTLLYLGRRDSQVKIRGQRVELGEVETRVRQALDSSVSAAVVAEMIQPEASPDSILVVFVSLQHVALSDDEHAQAVGRATAGIKEQLSERLPRFMIPTSYIPLSKIPLTATGKTDRRRLRAMGGLMTMRELAALSRKGVINQRRQPETESELLLLRLWAEVLDCSLESISADDGFIGVGGDSVGAMRLVSLARDRGFGLTVRDVFQKPMLRDMSTCLKPLGKSSSLFIRPFSLLGSGEDEARCSAALLCGLNRDSVVDVLPCTPLQRSLFMREGEFMTRHVLEICKHIDLDKFRTSWDQVVLRNAVMRTRIVEMKGEGYVQVVTDEPTLWMACKSLDECEKYAERNRMGCGTRLARLAVVESEGCAWLVWDMHWALYDGWALRLLLKEAEGIYYEKPCRPLGDTSALVRYVLDGNREETASFWRRQFTGLTSLPFPPLSATNENPPQINSEVQHKLPPILTRSDEFTAATIIRAGLSLVIAWTLNQAHEAIFGATVSGRQADMNGIERLAGPVFSTVPLRIPIDWHGTAGQLLSQVQSQAAEMVPYEQTGLDGIAGVSAEAEAAVGFRTLLVVQSAIKKGDVRFRDEGAKVFARGLVAERHTIVELGLRSGAYPLYVEFNRF
ncbi:hypothetical protein CDD80_3318 [Ophiocordyceps camponoti-rufipedis]|uniref:Carrier domain-containing protein n=1 Tax=Ophiocordyceps camponoti-rufipedis TaxID=2004952 RepID=A0A2C5YZA1_9HYPO|nr:hypothetical protein CDD80_3318 [Ophiocordyceps camponoti-rufipedis]